MIEDIKDEDGLPKDNGIFHIEHASIGLDDDKDVFLRLDLYSPRYRTALLLEQKYFVELLDVMECESFTDDICAFLRNKYVHVTAEAGGCALIRTIGDVFEQRRVRFREDVE